jgi:hypothetical protein
MRHPGARLTIADTAGNKHGIISRVSEVNRVKTKSPQPDRLLGGYLFALCFYQIAIYRWPGGPPFILDPRAGIPVLLINHFFFDNKVIYPVEWITAGWLALMAGTIFFRGKLLKTYLISEFFLAAPTAYYIGVLAAQHGGDFAPGFRDVVLTFTLFTFFSLVPIALTVRQITRSSEKAVMN